MEECHFLDKSGEQGILLLLLQQPSENVFLSTYPWEKDSKLAKW